MDRFCKKCGAELIDGICPNCVQSETEKEGDKRFQKFFMSPNEKTIAVLGKAYSEAYLQKGKCPGGFAVVSDKRLYFFGRSYDICNNLFGQKGPRENKQSKTIDLKDVTGTGDSLYRPSRWLVLSIVHAFLIIICLIVGSVQPETETLAWIWVISHLFAVVFFVFMLIYFIVHKTTKFHMLTFQYNGGEIAFDIADFPAPEIAFFQRQLRLAKDKVAADNSNIEKNSIKEAVSSVIQSTPQSSKADELVKLADLLSKGILSQEEFEKMKKELI